MGERRMALCKPRVSSTSLRQALLKQPIVMKAGEPTEEDAVRLLEGARADEISDVELIRRLMLLNRLVAQNIPRFAKNGSGSVREVKLGPGTIYLITFDDKEIECGFEKGIRWRIRGELVSRNDVEKVLGVWPGYLDAIEQLKDYIDDVLRDLESRARAVQEQEYETKLKAEEDARRIWSNSRHPELRQWRERHPASEKLPQSIQHIRYIKRLVVSEPAYIYFLLQAGKVVYVGQTSSPWPGRILQHLNENAKLFDDVWYLEVDKPSLNYVERRFIIEFKPIYNRVGFPQSGIEDDTPAPPGRESGN
jgi:hypothetical protein